MLSVLFDLLNSCLFSSLFFTLLKLCVFSLLFHSLRAHTYIPCMAHLAHCAHRLQGNPVPREIGQGFTTSFKLDNVLPLGSCQMRPFIV